MNNDKFEIYKSSTGLYKQLIEYTFNLFTSVFVIMACFSLFLALSVYFKNTDTALGRLFKKFEGVLHKRGIADTEKGTDRQYQQTDSDFFYDNRVQICVLYILLNFCLFSPKSLFFLISLLCLYLWWWELTWLRDHNYPCRPYFNDILIKWLQFCLFNHYILHFVYELIIPWLLFLFNQIKQFIDKEDNED
jgi:hypothetical protein